MAETYAQRFEQIWARSDQVLVTDRSPDGGTVRLDAEGFRDALETAADPALQVSVDGIDFELTVLAFDDNGNARIRFSDGSETTLGQRDQRAADQAAIDKGVDRWNEYRNRLRRAPQLSDAYLASLELSFVDLSNADLYRAVLSGSNFRSADFTSAILIRADLTDCRLIAADLSGADLAEANLVAADMTGANLSGANLTGALLAGANLTAARLVGAILTNARWDDATVWPEGFSPPSDPGANQVDRPTDADRWRSWLAEDPASDVTVRLRNPRLSGRFRESSRGAIGSAIVNLFENAALSQFILISDDESEWVPIVQDIGAHQDEGSVTILLEFKDGSEDMLYVDTKPPAASSPRSDFRAEPPATTLDPAAPNATNFEAILRRAEVYVASAAEDDPQADEIDRYRRTLLGELNAPEGGDALITDRSAAHLMRLLAPDLSDLPDEIREPFEALLEEAPDTASPDDEVAVEAAEGIQGAVIDLTAVVRDLASKVEGLGEHVAELGDQVSVSAEPDAWKRIERASWIATLQAAAIQNASVLFDIFDAARGLLRVRWPWV